MQILQPKGIYPLQNLQNSPYGVVASSKWPLVRYDTIPHPSLPSYLAGGLLFPFLALALSGRIGDKQAGLNHKGPDMLARIYQPARNAMQSGQAKTKQWILEYEPGDARELDPLMGWTASDDMDSQVHMRFATREAAVDFAKAHNIPYQVEKPHKRKPNIRAGGYGDNFAANRKTVWTH